MAEKRNKRGAQESGYVINSNLFQYNGEYGPKIDLGLAANPIGSAIDVQKLGKEVTQGQLSEYHNDPMHEETKTLLVEGLDLKNIDHNDVVFHPNGSYGAGDEIIRALSVKLSVRGDIPSLYAPAYSFPNISQYALRHRISYRPIPAEGSLFAPDSLNYFFKMDESKLKDNIAYIDYPNNPTGNADAKMLREVVTHVAQQGGIPFVDLAFGEIMGEEYKNAIQFTVDHGGVCVGSLTKTLGLPSLRAGYIIMGHELSKKLYPGGAKLVFGLSPYAQKAYELLFTKDGRGNTLAKKHSEASAKYNEDTNKKFYPALEQMGLYIAPTLYATPIQTVFSDEPINLYHRLRTAGLFTESLSDYKSTLDEGSEGYGNSAVRILTPRKGQLEQTMERIQIAMNLPDDIIK